MQDALFDAETVLNNEGKKPVLLGEVPGQDVTLRVDQKLEPFHMWQLTDDLHGLWISKQDIQVLTAATDFRIKFTDAANYIRVARFSPEGIDRAVLWDTCRIKPKGE